MMRAGTRMITPKNPFPFKIGDRVIDTERNRPGKVDAVERGVLWLLNDGGGKFAARTAVCILDPGVEAARKRARIIAATPKKRDKAPNRPLPPVGTSKATVLPWDVHIDDYLYLGGQFHLVRDMRVRGGTSRVLLFRTRPPLVVDRSVEVYRRNP
ncbi:hypothetical protein [Streptomyces sp. NPDC059994]|uniref:hypothetical protein n=1 Tax=Streptomyces sp. NPDC059994 TaxID=3347029 RepID=UPI0036CC049A